MPIYEYECGKCDEEFEALVFRTDEDVACPQCKDGKVKRLMSVCGYKSAGNYAPPSGASGCANCSSTNCSTCH